MQARGILTLASRALTTLCLVIAATMANAADSPPCRGWLKSKAAPLYAGDQLLDGGWVRKPESNTVVVFVHGIFSNNEDAWLHAGDGGDCVYWPDLLQRDAAFDGAGIFVASYYTSLTSRKFDVIQAANQLLSVLATPWRGHPYAALQYPNVIFVAHSLGGVVTRRLLASEWQTFKNHKLGLVLMASPAKGSGWADRASWISEKLRNEMAQQLRPDDPVLNEVHQKFLTLVRQDPDGRKIMGMEQFENQFLECSMSFFVCMSTTVLLKNIVTENDGGGYFGAAQIVPGTDHSTIVKPESEFKQSHIRLKNFFQANFTALRRLFPSASGAGTLTLTGEKPASGWRSVRTQTLRLSVYDAVCGPQRPHGCIEELPSLPTFPEPPSMGARRWRAGAARTVTLMAGDAERYEFIEEISGSRVRVWAKTDPAKAASAALYEREFVLEEYGETGTEKFTDTRALCASPDCTMTFPVPTGVRVSHMIENAPMGRVETRWAAGQPVVGRYLYLQSSEPTEAGTSHTFVLSPAHAAP